HPKPSLPLLGPERGPRGPRSGAAGLVNGGRSPSDRRRGKPPLTGPLRGAMMPTVAGLRWACRCGRVIVRVPRLSESQMRTNLYHILSGLTEERFDRTEDFEEARRIAHSLVAHEGIVGPVLIEHRGTVVRLFVLTVDGRVAEDVIGMTERE